MSYINSHLVIILFSLCGFCAGSLTKIEWVSESSTFYNVSEPVYLTDSNNAEMQLQIEMNISSGPEENLTVAVRVELMPEWIYWSASAYLLFISVVGLFMNMVVIVVILNDSQVIKISRNICYVVYTWIPGIFLLLCRIADKRQIKYTF